MNMRRVTGMMLCMGMLAVCGRYAEGTPSTEYWTPCISDVQGFNVWHLGVDNYFTVDKKAESGEQGAFATDIGITVGVLPCDKVLMEVGVDAFYPSDYPYYFNAKLGTPEGALFAGSPALNVGIFNVGTEHGVTDYNVVDFIAGKTLPFSLGRLHVGYYTGNDDLLVSSSGEKEGDGFMIGYDRWLIQDKLLLGADYASGDNAIGGGGVGVYYYFSKDVSILVGPVWFNDSGVSGETKWTTQLDANF